ncbi:LysE family translocator [Algibacillus agarilyticus]|uniref:LysE family translocator n=1 Tax=Algibacillus agarilyticus TaxID=2234133 RepID=UPI000DD0D9F7|nr:LysE family translocator [Algibacillus agarilyticus]
MTLTEWLALCSICLLGAMLPGPSLMLISQQALNLSVKHGCIASIAHATGIAVWAFASVMGLSIVFTTSPYLYSFLLYGGAGFLFWLGCRALMDAPVEDEKNLNEALIIPVKGLDPSSSTIPGYQTEIDERVLGYAKSAFKGFSIAFLNPKSAIFFTALFSQFVVSDSLSFNAQTLLILTPFTIDAVWFCSVCISLSYVKSLYQSNLNLGRMSYWLTKISGILFITLAFKTIITA